MHKRDFEEWKQKGEFEQRVEELEKVLDDALQKASKNSDGLIECLQQLEGRWGLHVFVHASRPWCEMLCDIRLRVGNYPVSHPVNTKRHKQALR